MAAHKEEEEFYVGVELDAASGQVRAHRNPNPNPKSPRGAATTAGPGRRKKKKTIPPPPSSPVVSGKRKKKPRIDPEEFLAHSYKRAPPIWSPEDELRIAEALLSATNQGQINMSLYYERAREFLPPRSNNTQLYEKMRRMRSRYRSIQNRVAKADEELGFQFKSEHEARLYQIWKRIWSPSSADADNAASQRRESSPFSNESEQNDNNGNNNNDNNDNDNDNEDDEENSGSENKNRNLSDIGDQNGAHPRTDATETAFLEKVFGKFQSAVENMEASFAKAVESLADRGCKRVSDVVDEAEKGRLMSVCGCSKVFAKFNELRSEAMSSREIPPGVSSSDAQALQEKWRSLWLDELKVFSQRLELMQEECKLCIRGIESSNGAVSSNPS